MRGVLRPFTPDLFLPAPRTGDAAGRSRSVLEPDVPWENVLAFVEAVEEYGALQ